MTITRVGTNQKYSEGWDKIFSSKPAGKKSAEQPAADKPAAEKKAAAGAKAAKKGKK